VDQIYVDDRIEHPDPDIDIACLNISYFINNLLNEIYFKFVDESLLASFDEEELDIAQRVFFIGYPDDRLREQRGWVSTANCIPAVRRQQY